MTSLVETVAAQRAREQLAAIDFKNDPCPQQRRRQPGTFGFRKGEANCRAKRLTPDTVREIRRCRAAGERLNAIGERFGITDGMVSKIVRRAAYAWVGEVDAA